MYVCVYLLTACLLQLECKFWMAGTLVAGSLGNFLGRKCPPPPPPLLLYEAPQQYLLCIRYTAVTESLIQAAQWSIQGVIVPLVVKTVLFYVQYYCCVCAHTRVFKESLYDVLQVCHSPASFNEIST